MIQENVDLDGRHFDSVVHTLTTTGTRRGLLRLLTGLPLAGALAAVLAPESEARRKTHRSQGHKRSAHPRHHAPAHHQPDHAAQGKQVQAAGHRRRRKKKSHCQPESVAQTCAGTCGRVLNTCGTVIDCGACNCGGCQICQTCDAATGQCVPNGSVVGQVCSTCRTCTAAGQCAPAANGTTCDDGNACTQSATCQGGVCVGTNPVICNFPTMCHAGSGTCDPTTGRCQYPNAPNGTVCEGGKCCNGACCPGCCGADGTCCSGCCGADGTCGACRVFVTSTTHNGNLGGLVGADAICQNLATAAGLPGSYRAWLSDSTDSPSTRFRCTAATCSAQGYQRVDGVTVATNWDTLTDGTLDAAISVTEQNTSTDIANTWTHTRPDGTVESSDYHCNHWTANQSNVGDQGVDVFSDSRWTHYVPGPCDIGAHLYCFQQE